MTAQADNELGPLFRQHKLPPPKLVMRTHLSMTLIVSLIYSDLLALVPVQWTQFELTRDALQTIDVVGQLPAPPIYGIWRAGLPLTPAANYFCALMRRAVANARPRVATTPAKDRGAPVKA